MDLRSFCGRLALPFAAAMMPVGAAAPAHATERPALWVVRDADTTVYLFGTFHALDPQTAWVDRRIATALAMSDRLVLETVIPDNVAEMKRRGSKALAGQPKAFISATSAAMREGHRQGLSVDHGADATLRRRAEALGKPVDGLETLEEQLKALSQIPTAPAARTVPAQASTPTPAPATAPVTMADLLGAWRTGDGQAFARMLASFEAKSPTAYRMLIADRNARWEQRLEAIMARPGTVFVAVGAGHLAGKDSLLALLEAKGLTAERID